MGNYLFCDGHVKSLKPTATDAAVNMWTIENYASSGGGGSGATQLQEIQTNELFFDNYPNG